MSNPAFIVDQNFLALLELVNAFKVPPTAFPASIANSKPLNPLNIFLPALAVVANNKGVVAPAVAVVIKPAATSSRIASLMIPAVYAKFIAVLFKKPPIPPLVDCPIAAAVSYALASLRSELKSPCIILNKLFGPDTNPLVNKGMNELVIILVKSSIFVV